MEKEVKNCRPTQPPENFLQWGNTKRLRCVKVHVRDEHGTNGHGRGTTATFSGRVVDRRSSSSLVTNTAAPGREVTRLASSACSQQHPFTSHRVLRNNSEASPFGLRNLIDHSSSPEKSERQNHHQAKVGSGKASAETMTVEKKTPNQPSRVNNNGGNGNGNHENIYNHQPMVWPKFIIALSSKEKEEDFMAMKGSKLPQRPKKRSKFLQRTLNLVSPGSWLCDLTQERYEVREKKSSKKRPKGLKAMVRSMDSDSD